VLFVSRHAPAGQVGAGSTEPVLIRVGGRAPSSIPAHIFSSLISKRYYDTL